MSSYILPDEILLIIFNYCNTYDLIRLNSVCKQFYNITSELLKKRSNYLLVTGQMSEKFRERCQPLISSFISKYMVSNMWQYASYGKKIIDPIPEFILREQVARSEASWSKLLMTKDKIVLGNRRGRVGYCLCVIDRTKNGSLSNNWIIKKCNSQIYDTVLCNDVLVSSHEDNSIREWTIKSLRGRKYIKQKLLHSGNDVQSDVHITCSMDITSRNIITSSRNGVIKIWNYTPQEGTILEENITLKLNEFYDEYGVFSRVAFDFTGTKFAAGCRSQNSSLSCIIYDINNCSTEKYEKIDVDPFHAPFAFKILWEDHNTILCHEQSEIIKMDVRTNKAVCKWSLLDYPQYTQAFFTCMSSDHLYAIMTGMSNGQVVLWDQRQNSFTQRYNICNSSIRDLEFDSSHMFSIGYKIYELDFAKHSSNIIKDNLIRKLISDTDYLIKQKKTYY